VDFIRVGYICELLVAADLNARCGRAYPNPEPQTPHDVYVHTSRGWLTVQVKKTHVNRNTKQLYDVRRRRKTKVTSDVLALVDFEGRRVSYIPNIGKLPPEIPKEPTDICSKLVVFASQEAKRAAVSIRV
jgi:hypothetical protein